MKSSVLKFVKWFCRHLTLNEFHSALTIMHEVLNDERHDIEFKPEAKPPHYRNFRVGMEPPLTEAPAKNIQPELSWQQLQREYKQKHGKELTPVKRQDGAQIPPNHCACEHCGAPILSSKKLVLSGTPVVSSVGKPRNLNRQ